MVVCADAQRRVIQRTGADEQGEQPTPAAVGDGWIVEREFDGKDMVEKVHKEAFTVVCKDPRGCGSSVFIISFFLVFISREGRKG